MTDFITETDLKILDFIAEHLRFGFGDVFFPFITHLGDSGILWIALAIILIIPKKTRAYGIQISISLVLGLIICNVTLKPLVARIRPFDLNLSAEVLIPKPHDYSFPSGHTTSSFAAASALYFSHCRYRKAAIAVAFLIAFSRLYVYVHYPSDVIAGMLTGILCGRISTLLIRIYSVKSTNHDV